MRDPGRAGMVAGSDSQRRPSARRALATAMGCEQRSDMQLHAVIKRIMAQSNTQAMVG